MQEEEIAIKNVILGALLCLSLLAALPPALTIHPAQPALAGISSLPPIDWTHYHSYNEIVTILFALNDTYPNIVDLYSIGKSHQNRDIYCVRLTNESDPVPKPEVFFVGYHHAREPITAELTLYFLVYMATNYGTNATVTRLIDETEIYTVPALNVNGFDLFAVNDYQRKNARPTNEDGDGLIDEDPPEDADGDGFIEELWDVSNPFNPMFIRWEGTDNDSDGLYAEDWIGGVDLNRNYNRSWQLGSSNPASEIYKGPAPFSEPETQAIRNLAAQHNFLYAITYHSGAELVLYPWGDTWNPPPDEAEFIEISQTLSTLSGGTPYDQSIGLYPSYGLIDDWMYATYGTRIVTCEIFENATFGIVHPGPEPNMEWQGGLKYWFNPFPQNIPASLNRWLPTLLYMTDRTSNALMHNIAITETSATRTIIGQGYTTGITFTVQNQGDYAETTTVTLKANATILATYTNVNVAIGGSATRTFSWNTDGYTKGTYTISAVATPVSGEVHTADNTRTISAQITIPGDVTGDFMVDIQDVSLLCINWYHPVPPAPANPDINGDGKINVIDVSIMGKNWQKHALP